MPRQIPGTSKVVCIDAAHHNDGAGDVLIVDLKYGWDSREGDDVLVRGAGDCPYPLNDKYFLVSYDPYSDSRMPYYRGKDLPAPILWNAREVGIYLADTFGTLELVYRDDRMSAMFPMLIHPRKTPPVLPEVIPAPGETDGTFVIQNVNEGLPESMRGKARHLMITEAHERHNRVILDGMKCGVGGWENKTVLGTVPIEEDGSASFKVPADKAVFFSVLDENYQALHTMRMTTDIKAGERMACIGCHEPVNTAPKQNAMTLAIRRAPSVIEPPPWGVRMFSFTEHVQPVLNRNCISCHDGSKDKGKHPLDLRAGDVNAYDLSGGDGPKGFRYRSYWNLQKYIERADMYEYMTPPGSWGSRVSPLMKHLKDRHKNMQLPESDWRVLCAWIDCNLPYLNDWRRFAADPELRLQVEKEERQKTALE